MRDAAAPGKQEPVTVRPDRRDEELQSAWASEETVPLRVSSERVEAEERAARLGVVIGRHSQRR